MLAQLALSHTTRTLTTHATLAAHAAMRTHAAPNHSLRAVSRAAVRAAAAATPPARHASTAAAKPALRPPETSPQKILLLNSLSNQLEPFEPLDADGAVKWYVCGPTVYDSTHMGHARNYVAFDIVRRVLMHYFGFDIFFVMNITDIDDKIILRTQRNHLERMLAALEAAIAAAAPSSAAARDAAAAAAAVLAPSAKPSLAELTAAQAAIATAASADGLAGVPAVCDVKRELLRLTAEQERAFFEDLAALRVMPPDAVTRVTDYVPEIVAYIETILANGYGYEANGSVYFDVAAFRASGKAYGKLAKLGELDDAELLADAEGALTADAAASEKRAPSDFALWKRSKPGEPAWASPWGEGRPGWHIECSAMSSDLLGSCIDLKAGGADLKFPHHENQMAQIEAHFDCAKCVSYFLHSGHLQIEGLKMSKSLKNFITVREALESYSARQMRFLFLLHRYHEPMEYSANTMSAAVDLERRFGAFELSFGARLREAAAAERAASSSGGGGGEQQRLVVKWSAQERELHSVLLEKQRAVDAALRAGIDTPSALKALEQLVRATNTYMQEVPGAERGSNLLQAVGRFYGRILGSFGVTTAFGEGATAAAAEDPAAADAAATPLQLVEALSAFRDTMRQLAIKTKRGGGDGDGTSAASFVDDVLRECDVLRDTALRPLGVKLEDRPSGVAQFSMADPKLLMAEAEREREAAAGRAARGAAKAALEAQLKARALVPPAEMFLPKHDEAFERKESFGELDGDGIPLADAAGEALSKSQRKKLVKVAAKQAKAYEAATGKKP